MKLTLLALAAAPLLAAVFVQSSSSQVKNHVDKLQASKSLTASLSILPIGGSATEATLKLQKPNMFRFENESKLISSDGATVWSLDKKSGQYSEDPASPESISKAFGDDIWIWSAFFDAKFAEAIGAAKPGKARKMKGVSLKELDVTFAKRPTVTATLLMDDATGLGRGAVWHVSKDGAVQDTLVFADKLETGATEFAASEFVFVPGRGHMKVEKTASHGGSTWKDVELIFMGSCGACHGAQRPAAGLRLNSYEAVMAGRGGRPIVVGGDPGTSSVLRNLKGEGKLMPPGRKLPNETIAKIEKWIADGAKKE